eukprot:14929215-Ditylum_brightwellii.AAC.1
MEVQESIKVKETIPLPRVQDNTLHIIPNDQNAPPPRVPQGNNDMHAHRPHVIPQYNAIYQHMCLIPPYFANAVYNEDTGKMEEYCDLIEREKQRKMDEILCQ